MNKKIIWLIPVVIIIGVTFLLWPSKKPTPPAPISPTPTPTTAPAVDLTPRSLNDLIAKAQTIRCGFQDPAAKLQGQVFLSANEVRADLTTSGSQVATHLIIDQQKKVYTWTDDQNIGSHTSPLNPDKKLSYVCESWKVLPSMFVIPSGIKFTK